MTGFESFLVDKHWKHWEGDIPGEGMETPYPHTPPYLALHFFHLAVSELHPL